MKINIPILFFLLFFCTASKLFASDTKYYQRLEQLSEERFQTFTKIADELRCPTCIGLSIQQSDAPFAVQIKKAALEQVEQGKSYTETLAYFTKRYGDWILRTPPKEGFHLITWLIPFILILSAIGFFFLRYREKNEGKGQKHRSNEDILKELENRLKQANEKG